MYYLNVVLARLNVFVHIEKLQMDKLSTYQMAIQLINLLRLTVMSVRKRKNLLLPIAQMTAVRRSYVRNMERYD